MSTRYEQRCAGDVIYLNVLGKPIILLNSEEAAQELLDKRNTNYSRRPYFALFAAYASPAVWGRHDS